MLLFLLMDKGKPHLRLPRINYIILKESIVVKLIIIYNIVMFVKRRLFTFLLLTTFLTGLGFAATKKKAVTVPTKIQNKIKANEESTKSWYICELKSKTKAGNVVIGPVEHREQILLIWIANSIVPNKDYCIAKNKTYISKNPETFFKEEYENIKKDITELGLGETYEKYFFTNYLTRATKLTLTEEEQGMVSNKEAPVEEPEVKDEEVPEVKEEVPEVKEEVGVSEPEPEVEPQPQPAEKPEVQVKTNTVSSSTNTSSNFLEPTIKGEEDGSYVYKYETPKNTSVVTTTTDKDIDIDSIKEELKNQLKDELINELRGELKTKENPPAPEPEPIPEPETVPEPAPEPTPEPTPVQTPEPTPEPEPVSASVPEPAAQTEETPVEEESGFELPISTSISSSVNRYQRENLLDYAPKKTTALPSDDDEPETILIAQPDKADAAGVTLLMKAARAGNEREIRNLILSGADVNLKDKEGWTALMYAVRYQQNQAVTELLIASGSKIKEKNKYDVSALSLAATYNENPEILKQLLTSYSPAEKELNQAFILMLTDNSSSDYSKTIKADAFIQKGIALNSFYNGKTPLMYAAQYCTSTTVIRRLLEYGASTTIRSADGKTAWDFAKQNTSLPHDDVYWALNKK